MTRGRRTSLVTIERRGSMKDSAGQLVETWTTLRQEWGLVESVSGREYFNASAERATVTHRIKVYGGSGVAPRDRVTYGERVFDIKTVLDVDSRGTEQELMCLEVV